MYKFGLPNRIWGSVLQCRKRVWLYVSQPIARSWRHNLPMTPFSSFVQESLPGTKLTLHELKRVLPCFIMWTNVGYGGFSVFSAVNLNSLRSLLCIRISSVARMRAEAHLSLCPPQQLVCPENMWLSRCILHDIIAQLQQQLFQVVQVDVPLR